MAGRGDRSFHRLLWVFLMVVIGAGTADGARADCFLCAPLQNLYGEIAGPSLRLDPPLLGLPAQALDAGPAVLLQWSNPAGLPGTGRVSVLRGREGEAAKEIWFCDASTPGCSTTSHLDNQGLEEGERYVYQVVASDGIGVGVSQPRSVAILAVSPRRLTALVTGAGQIELDWSGTAAAAGYRIVRRDRLDGATTSTDRPASVTRFLDPDARTDGIYEYEVFTCRALTPAGACDASALSSAVRLGVGGGNAIHRLEERVRRHRFRPDALLEREPQLGNPFLPGERLDFRDETTAAPLVKLTNNPHEDFHLYSNIPVWSADGSRILFHTTGGWHAGWRVMDADGSALRDVRHDALGLGGSGETGPWWSQQGVRLTWSPVDPELLFYTSEIGELGRLDPPSDVGPQLDHGVFWTAPQPLTRGFWLTLHPDGAKALGVHAIQGRPLQDGVLGSTAYLIDLLVGATDATTEVVDDLGTQRFAHQLWFTEALDYSFTYELEAGVGQYLVVDPLVGSPAPFELSPLTFRRAGMGPQGQRAAHLLSPRGLGITDFATGTTVTIDSEIGGHTSWSTDDPWFVSSDGSSLWRVWLNGHRAQIATPFTNLIYEGETHTGLMPSVSPDGTKIAFKAPMHGDIDLYSAVMRLPDPPENLEIVETELRWDPPLRAREVEHYNLWEADASGQGYRLLAQVPALTGGYELTAATGQFFRITAVEHSGLEGFPSREVSTAIQPLLRLRYEPHRGFDPPEPGEARVLAPRYHGELTGLYSLLATTGSADLSDAVTIPVSAGQYRIWGRVRADTTGDHFRVYDDGLLLGALTALGDEWSWVEIALADISVGALELLPSAGGVEIDQLLLSTDLAFVPAVATLLDVAPQPPTAVTDLEAIPSAFHCALTWSAAAAEDFSHFNVYAASELPAEAWDQARRVASVGQAEFVDWGLAPDTLYTYRVGAVDRRQGEGPLSETTCTTDAITARPLSFESPEEGGFINPDPATGAWSFAYDVPPDASPSEYVAWMRVESISGQHLSDDLTRTVGGVEREWDLASALHPITQVDGGPPERNTPVWVFVSLATSGPLDILRAAPLSGVGELRIAPVSGRVMHDLRVAEVVLTNDLSFVPAGISDYLLPDTRAGLSLAPDRSECDDGLDNDGDGLYDVAADPGCDDAADASERSALACDNGLDDDADGKADLQDPGCGDGLDDSEWSTTAQCDDGLDNDQDGAIDGADSDCPTLDTVYEEIPECDDGLDNDGDGSIDFRGDAGCRSAADRSERFDCEDGLDNDFDGLIDHGQDIGCAAASAAREDPACSDDRDNDGDGGTDWDGGSGGGEADPECRGRPHHAKETALPPADPGACGLGLELCLLLPALRRARGLRRALGGNGPPVVGRGYGQNGPSTPC